MYGMKTRQQGFTLLEVLITIVVVAIGLLGVAGMQVASIKLSTNADIRSRASAHVAQIYERISSNPSRAKEYELPKGAAPSGVFQTQLQQWKQTLQTTLPSGDGTIVVTEDAGCGGALPTASGSICWLVTVTVQWDESRTKRTDGSDGTVTFTSFARF
jgi:type IV pilus assembly protein PilV